MLFERCVAVFQVAFGAFLMYAVWMGFYRTWEYLKSIGNIDYWKLLSGSQSGFLLAVLAVIAAVKLWRQKALGWLLSVLFWLLLSLNLITNLVLNFFKGCLNFESTETLFAIGTIVLGFVVSTVLYGVLREKYRLTKREIWWCSGVVGLLILVEICTG